MDDYYEELLDCVQAAKDGRQELWSMINVNMLRPDYDYKNEPKTSPYITKEELMILMIKDYDTTIKRISKIK